MIHPKTHLPLIIAAVFSASVIAVAFGVASVFLNPVDAADTQMTVEDVAGDLEDWSIPTSISDIPITTKSTKSSVALKLLPLETWKRMAGDPVIKPNERGSFVPILFYHHIRDMRPGFTAKDRKYTVTPAAFEAQMESLVRAGYHSISPQEFAEAMRKGWELLPSKPVMITFDDGFRDQYENAFPVLKRLGLQSTFFVLSHDYNIPIYMTPKMIRELDQSGLVSIGSHTKHHAYLSRLSKTVRDKEIAGSKQELEKLLGHAVETFAYPFGSFDARLAKEVEDAGYTLGFGVRLGALHAQSSRFQLRRIPVLDMVDIVPLCERLSRP